MTAIVHGRHRAITGTFWFQATGAAVAFIVAGATASSDDGLVLCPLRRCSGGYCPGCGLTRSAGHLVRGEFAASIATHPYLVVLVAQFAALVGLWTLASEAVRNRLRASVTPVALANAGVLLVLWLARMASGAIPIPFVG